MMMGKPTTAASSRSYMNITPSSSVNAKSNYNKMLATDIRRGTLVRMQAGGAAAMPMPSDPISSAATELDKLQKEAESRIRDVRD